MSTEIILSPGNIAGLTLSEPYQVSLEEEGGIIRHASIDFGYLGRDIERCLKKVPYTYGTAFAEKCDFLAAAHYAAVYAGAVEQLGNIHLPERAQHIRKIIMEISRIKAHIMFLAKIAQVLGLYHVYNFCLRESEKYCDLLELYCGSRLCFGAIVVGGVSDDATDGFLFKIEKTFQETKNFIEELKDIFLENNFVEERLSGLAILKKEQALQYGVTGPNARASGVMELGDGVSNAIAAFGGDALGRLHCRIAEVFYSIELVTKAMKKIPAGNYRMEISDEFSAPPGDVLSAVDGPRGKIYALVFGGGTNKPADVCFGSPSFNHLNICEKLLIGGQLDDMHLIIASLGISFSEVDK